MTLIRSRNPDLGKEERTLLSAAALAAATTLTVDNTEGFSANDFVVVGDLGTEAAEVVRITAVTSATALAVTALDFAHVVDEPVQKTPYDQTRFYTSTTETGTFTLITTVDSDFANPDQFTVHRYEAGTNSDWYKVSWYNSNSATETSQSSARQPDPMYCTVADVEGFLNLRFGTDSEIPFKTVAQSITQNTKLIESETNSAFRSISITSSAYEYHDGKKETDSNYYTHFTPLISVDTLQTTSSAEDTAAASVTWNTLTENTDFFADGNTGRIALTNSNLFPAAERNRFRVAYTYGRSSVPEDVRKLCVYMTARDLILGAAARSVAQGRSAEIGLTWLDKEIERIIVKYRNSAMRNS